MKAVLFLLSLWFCFFAFIAVSDALECYTDGSTKPTKIASNCTACGYHSVDASDEPHCEAITERKCLTEKSMGYNDLEDQKTFSKVGECTPPETQKCKHMLYICTSNKCNMGCGPATPSPLLPTNLTTSPTTLSTTTTTTPSPTTTTTTSNHGNLETASLTASDAIGCYTDGTDTIAVTASNCIACGYHSVRSAEPLCAGKTERMCLSGTSFKFDGDNSTKQTYEIIEKSGDGECVLKSLKCNHMVMICQDDKCNMGCPTDTPTSNSTPSPKTTGSTTTTTTTTTTTPSSTTTTSNHGNLEGAVFALISLIFAFIY